MMCWFVVKSCLQAGYDNAMQGPTMPYPGGEWNEFPAPPPPEAYAGPWPPEQYAAYIEQYGNPPVSSPVIHFISWTTFDSQIIINHNN